MDLPRYGTPDLDYAARLATTPPDEDGPVWMVNLMRYRDRAEYADGRATELSGQQADDLYTPLGPLAAVGAEIVFAATVDQQLLGDQTVWERVGVVKYPTRRAFLEMQQREDFQELHVHKDAGMASTIVMGCLPMPGMAQIEPLVDWADVPHPPTEDDGAVCVIHVIHYNEPTGGGTPEDMRQYQEAAAQKAIPAGARVSGWFTVEGTIIGDGRSWDQVRFNTFPSKAAFMEVVLDPDRLSAQREHREPAMADTYTMITRPLFDALATSVG